jgi:hypothetical protein
MTTNVTAAEKWTASGLSLLFFKNNEACVHIHAIPVTSKLEVGLCWGRYRKGKCQLHHSGLDVTRAGADYSHRSNSYS